MKLFLSFLAVFSWYPMAATAQQTDNQSSNTERAFTASTLQEARMGFMTTHGLRPKDCDPVSGGWVCSELDVSDATPVWQSSPLATSTQEAEVCTANGSTLDEAHAEFSSQCPWQIRETCAPLTTGGWACSTASIENSIYAVDTDSIYAEESASAESQVSDEAVTAVCTANGQTIGEAQTQFSAECPWRIRETCDPLSTGGWACSTAKIENSTNALGAESVDTAGGTTDTHSVDTVTSVITSESGASNNSVLKLEAESVAYDSALWSERENGLVYTGASRYLLTSRKDDANLVFDFAIPTSGAYRFTMRSRAGTGNNPAEPPNDVWLKVPGQEWLKVYMRRDGDWHIDAIGERNGTHSRELNTYELSAGALQVIVSGRSQGHIIDWVALELQDVKTVASNPVTGSVSGTGVMNTRYQPGDLVIIAHDSGPDTDDMQAIVANRAIMDAFPAVNHLLVGAAQGHAWANPTAGSEAHTQSLFPDWINAKASTSGTTSFDGESVIKVADAIEKNLNNGGTVHIAEGGPSDFTAEVIRLLQSRGVQAQALKRIRVVQHSAGARAWNEAQTSGANIALVKSAATWVPIANGNVGGNASADFQEPASSSMCQRYMKSALASRYASQWAWAYSTIGNSRKCDQSDSVELLYILNDTSTKTFDQFASRYM